jgi:GTP-binding protein
VADIPGLIKDAHKGAGLGFQFLRHIERTKILLHLVDVSDHTTGDPVENLEQIINELKLYREDLIKRPQIIVATKMDVVNEEKLNRLITYCKKNQMVLFKISSVTGEGIQELLLYLSGLIEKERIKEQQMRKVI